MAGVELLFPQLVRTGWEEWPLPESLQNPPVRATYLAANRFGDLYVLDGENYRILLLPGDGSGPRTAGGWGGHGDRFQTATHITASPGLNVLVCDNTTQRIVIFDRRLNFVGERVVTTVGPSSSDSPYKIAQNRLGEMVVVTSGEWEVHLISADFRLMATVGDAAYGESRLGEITDLSLGGNDEIGIVDADAGLLLLLTRAGEIKRRIPLPEPGTELLEWWGDRWLVMGPSGDLYELSASGREFRMIPGQRRKEPAPAPGDFVVSRNTVVVTDDPSGKLYRARLISVED